MMPDASLVQQSPPVSDHLPTKQQQPLPAHQHLPPSSAPSSNTARPASPSTSAVLSANSNGHTTTSNASNTTTTSTASHNNNNTHSRTSSRSSTPASKPGDDTPDLKPPLKSKLKGKEPSRPTTPKPRPSTTALHYEQYVTRDNLHASALAAQSEHSLDVIRSIREETKYWGYLRQTHPSGAIFGYGYAGFGNGTTDGNVRVVYPCQRKRPGGRKAHELRLTRAQLQEQADRVEMLVPVRLDIDFDKIKLRDTFTINMHEQIVPLELFVEQLVEDFHVPLPNPALLQTVTNSIKDQITDFYPHVFLADEPLDPVLPYTAYKNDDMRVLIKLNITIGQHTLVDQFEWDINNPMNSPEEFAQLLTRELSLSGEFTTAIAHSIREQCQLFTKALYVTGHPFDGRPVEDEDVRTAMLQSPITSVFRPYILAKEFTPLLYELSENELDRAEKSQSREQRRLKRVRTVNRRGGPTIPDLKDMPKTHRTQIVSSILPGAVQKITDLERSMAVKQVKDGESDEEDSDSEAEDLPPERTIPGFNNMTRRQRMAALNAQKVNSQARSQTPEIHNARTDRVERFTERLRHDTPQQHQHTPLQQTQVLHTVSKPTLPRRPGVPLHQDSALFKIKVVPAKLKKLIEDMAKRQMQEQQKEAMEKKHQEITRQQQAAATAPRPPQQTSQKAPQRSSPIPAVTASPLPVHPPAPRSNPPAPGEEAPSPPEWLTAALSRLRETYSNDRFEATMRRLAFDTETGQAIGNSQLPNAPGASVKWKWIPRIRCHDCPGKLYTPGPDQTVDSFLVHVKNRGHRERVDQRIQKERAASAVSS